MGSPHVIGLRPLISQRRLVAGVGVPPLKAAEKESLPFDQRVVLGYVAAAVVRCRVLPTLGETTFLPRSFVQKVSGPEVIWWRSD